MKELVEETLRLQHQAVDRYNAEAGAKYAVSGAAAQPPASAEEIRMFKVHLAQRGLSLPPSFECFLSLYNGIRDYARNISIRSIQQMVQMAASDAKKKDLSTVYSFIFFDSEYMSAKAGFVPESLGDDGEMKVVELPEYSADDPHEFDSFEEFLKEQLAFYQDVMRASS
jgi:hypothetical protein